MALKDIELGKILVEQSYLSDEDLKHAEKQAKENPTADPAPHA